MPVAKTKPKEMLERRRKVADLYTRSMSQQRIAERLGVDQATISLDLKWLKGEWKKEAVLDYDDKVAECLAKIGYLESTAWEAWDRSTQNLVVDVTKVEEAIRAVKDAIPATRGPKNTIKLPAPPTKYEMQVVKNIKERTVKGQAGDPRFLQLVQSCIELRAKIYGMYKDVNINNTQINVGVPAWDALVTEINTPHDDNFVEKQLKEIEALPPAPAAQLFDPGEEVQDKSSQLQVKPSTNGMNGVQH